MAKLTLCMMVRDEETMLADCLTSVQKAVDRMVIVDTGSTDGTRDVIRRFGAELIEHEWADDFAAARNAGLAAIDSGYVLILDADERLTSRGARLLRAVARRGQLDLGLLPLHDAAALDARPVDVLAGRARRGEPILLPRLMRRTPDLRFEGIVHESVSAWASAGRRAEVIDAPIVHYGAVPELRKTRGKDQRNQALLERRCELEPDHPTPRAHLAAELRRAGKWTEAFETARRAWSSLQVAASRGERHDPVLPASVLAHLALRFNELNEAIEVVAEALESEEHPNLHLLAGIAAERRVLAQATGARDLMSATRSYERCLELDGQAFASEVMVGATSWQAATRLGTVLIRAGEPERARRAFERALRSRKDLLEARLGLAEAVLECDQASHALTLLEPLLSDPGPDAWLLSAQAAMRLDSAADAKLFYDRARAAEEERPFIAPHRQAALVALERKIAGLEAMVSDEDPGTTCVFAWPRYDEREDLDVLLGGFGKLLADRPGLVLCLRHDRSMDGDLSRVEARLERAFSDHIGEGRDLQVMLVDQELETGQAVAMLAAPDDIALELPHTRGVRRRFLEDLGVRRVDSPVGLQQALGAEA